MKSARLIKYSVIAMAISLGGCTDHPSLALGTLERDRVLLKASATEIIKNLPIAEGADVREGDLIVQLDDLRQQAMVAQAEANVAATQAYLTKLQHGARAEDIASARSQVNGAKAQFIETEKAYGRVASLVNKKLVGAAELDAARARRDLAQATLDQAHENLRALIKGSRIEDLEQAEAQVALAKASLRVEQQNLAELGIRATRSGRLDQLPKHRGERPSIGEVVAVVLSSDAPYARVYIPETHRISIRAGTELVVRVDGFQGPLTGKVRWISQDPAFTPYFALNSTDRARLVYVAELALPATASELPSGLPVQVELPHE